ncbi:hypothetical protein D3C83_79480 [compost metagenome]
MLGKPGAFEKMNRTFRVTQAEPERGVEIVCAGEALVEAPQRRVVIGAHQPIDDPPREIAAYRDFQSVILE